MARERLAGAPYFRQFAEFARIGLSPLYERLTLAIADDPSMLAFAALAREEQPQANILFGTVHALLLSGLQDPLADYYPSCGGKRAADEGDVYTLFKAFVERHRTALEPLVRSRITNTNEVGRSALIYPGLDIVARETGAPLRTIEIGPSAGLNLNWFRYGYLYTDESGASLIARNPESALVLGAHLVGGKRPALSPILPEVASAVGLERNPVDLARPEERLWLRALIWPERTDRLARLDAALAIAEAHPPEIKQGDAARDLEGLIAGYPAGAPVALVHTLVTYQFDQAASYSLEAAISRASQSRPVYRVWVEWDGSSYPVRLDRYQRGERKIRGLARCDAHGGWLEWLED